MTHVGQKRLSGAGNKFEGSRKFNQSRLKIKKSSISKKGSLKRGHSESAQKEYQTYQVFQGLKKKKSKLNLKSKLNPSQGSQDLMRISSSDTSKMFSNLKKDQIFKNVKLEETQKFMRRQPMVTRV